MKLKCLCMTGAALVAFLLPIGAWACPRIDGLIDLNCDGKLKIVAVGDSIVTGIGDIKNNHKGGYVKRLRRHFPRAQIIGMGFSGCSSGRLLQDFTAALNQPGTGKTKKTLDNADLIIIDVGRNDYWDEKDPGLTVRNIARLTKLFKEKLGTSTGVPPWVTIAYMLPTKRSFQWTFLIQINYYLSHLNPADYKVQLNFHKLPLKTLSWDGIHPNSKGYAEMEKMIKKYLTGRLQREERRIRSDRDRDGVFDYFELNRFYTDPTLRDTDGDTLTDGTELFVTRTNPLNARSGPETIPAATQARAAAPNAASAM